MPSSSSSSSSSTARLLVTGASGQLGQLVLSHLLDTLRVEPSRIVAGSSNPDKLAPFAARGVLTRRVDFHDAASIKAAAQGVTRALVISCHDFDTRLTMHKTAVAALVAAGVEHICYTSLLNVDNATAQIAVDHRLTEAFVRESGVLGYSFLRNGIYYDNQAVWIAASHRSGKWFSAAQQGRLAGIARSDAALAAATALASDTTGANVYELSSVESLTIDEIVGNISQATAKTVAAAHVSEEELAKGIELQTGVPADVAKVYASFDTHTANGLSQARSNDFLKLVGRDAITQTQWIDANKDKLLAA